MPRILALFFLIPLFAACSTDQASDGLIVENPFHGPEQESDRYHLVVEELVQFGVEEEPFEEVLSSPAYVFEGPDGRVFILDQTRVVVFNSDGSFHSTFGREGEGPGEINRAFAMKGSPWGDLMIQNQGGQRLDFFAGDGTHLETVSRDELGQVGFVRPVAILKDSTIVFSGSLQGAVGTRVLHMDMHDWSVIDSFRVEEEIEIDIPGGISAGGSVAMMANDIVLSNNLRYELARYSLQGDTLQIVRRDVPDYTRPGYATFGSGFGVRMYSSVSEPAPLQDGYWLVESRWPTNIPDPDEHSRLAFTQGNPPEPDNHRSLDVFDEKRRLVFSVENEDMEPLGLGYIAHTIAPGEFLAVRYQPYPHVVRVRVRVEEG